MRIKSRPTRNKVHELFHQESSQSGWFIELWRSREELSLPKHWLLDLGSTQQARFVPLLLATSPEAPTVVLSCLLLLTPATAAAGIGTAGSRSLPFRELQHFGQRSQIRGPRNLSFPPDQKVLSFIRSGSAENQNLETLIRDWVLSPLSGHNTPSSEVARQTTIWAS